MLASGSALAQDARVVDSATARPIPGTTVSLRDSIAVLATQRTDDSGRFDLRAARAGAFTLQFRQIGYLPLEVHVQLDSGTRVSGTFRLVHLPVSLDTVVTDAPRLTLFNVTPGREFYRRHWLRGIGQFVSGFEIQRSGLSVLQYLGTVPGLEVVEWITTPRRNARDLNSPPTMAGRDGFLLASFGRKCIYVRVDHWTLPTLLYTHATAFIDDVVTADDIMGVEVYMPGEEPPEWAFHANMEIVIVNGMGVAFFAGGRVPQIRGLPRLMASRLDAVGAGGPARNGPVNVLTDAPPLFGELDLTGPKCPLVQIWTRIAW